MESSWFLYEDGLEGLEGRLQVFQPLLVDLRRLLNRRGEFLVRLGDPLQRLEGFRSRPPKGRKKFFGTVRRASGQLAQDGDHGRPQLGRDDRPGRLHRGGQTEKRRLGVQEFLLVVVDPRRSPDLSIAKMPDDAA